MPHYLDDWLMAFLDSPWNVIGVALFLFGVVLAYVWAPYLRLIFKSLRRNPLRTMLMSAATMKLVLSIISIWSVLWLLDLVTTERTKDFKAIVTERWQIPSQMPLSYERILQDGAAVKPGDVKPQNIMSWQFYGATLDAKKSRENLIFFFCVDPAKVLPMMEDFRDISDQERADLEDAIRAVQEDKRRIILGRDCLRRINKQVGERISLFSINYLGIDLDDCEIYATLPEGRLTLFGLMHRDRLNNALDAYERKNGKPHPLARKSLNLVWLQIPDTVTYGQLADQIGSSSSFTDPAVKMETASSGIAAFLDAYRDMLWGMRWLLVPAILAVLSLVMATAISISVRERRTEMAVLKVLGFGPTPIMLMVLAEAVLIGTVSGFVSACGTWLVINKVMGGLRFPIAFFPPFRVPLDALWWGPMIGGLTALVGSIVPAWSARSVRVAQVFAKLA
ncbi:MAG TPA: ABC transporter permease [Gemmataceae bacterium]|nr:ABC transporter permease [Gemmataceae bacterium]